MSDMQYEELKRMCNYPEIRNRWSAFLGQKFSVKGYSFLFWSTRIDREMEETFLSDSQGNHKSFCYLDTDFIWIPCIEDVLAWIVPKHYKEYHLAMDALLNKRYFDSAPDSVWTDHLKSWIAFYMHLERNKSWDGTKWIEGL